MFPFLGVLFSSLYSNSIGGMEMISNSESYSKTQGEENDTENIFSLNNEQPKYEADLRDETSVSQVTHAIEEEVNEDDIDISDIDLEALWAQLEENEKAQADNTIIINPPN